MQNGIMKLLPASLQPTEYRINTSFIRFLDHYNKSKPNTLEGSQNNSDVILYNSCAVGSEFDYVQAIQWQIKILNERDEWKKDTSFTDDIACNMASKALLGPAIFFQSLISEANLIENSSTRANCIIDRMEDLVTISEEIMEKSQGVIHRNYQVVLETDALFFAYNETGDPVYRDFAIHNSTFMYEMIIEGNIRIMSALNNGDSPSYMALTSSDYLKLAVALKGLTTLYNETGVDEFGNLCAKIATIFKFVFNKENDAMSMNNNLVLHDKIDLLTQSIVCLAMIELPSCSMIDYQEIASVIYLNALSILEKELKQKKKDKSFQFRSDISFRLFYSLFEYEINRQRLVG